LIVQRHIHLVFVCNQGHLVNQTKLQKQFEV
jgi:hypothetical protein